MAVAAVSAAASAAQLHAHVDAHLRFTRLSAKAGGRENQPGGRWAATNSSICALVPKSTPYLQV